MCALYRLDVLQRVDQLVKKWIREVSLDQVSPLIENCLNTLIRKLVLVQITVFIKQKFSEYVQLSAFHSDMDFRLDSIRHWVKYVERYLNTNTFHRSNTTINTFKM